MSTFKDFDLIPSLQKTLKGKKFWRPTEIQSLTLPKLLSGQSVVGLAETGSGKTLAYVLPVLQQLKTLETGGDAIKDEGRPRAVVVVPTRELGEQVAKVFKEFTHDTRLRVRSVLGGTTMKLAKRNASGCFEVLVATPSRIHQLQEHGLRLNDVRLIVFDEADEMLDPSFIQTATRLIRSCPPNPQMVLFSATMSPVVEGLIKELFANAKVYKTSGSLRPVATLTTQNATIVDGERFPVLVKLLKKKNKGGVLIFTNTKEQCDKLAGLLEENQFECAIFRGGMDRQERKQSLDRFVKNEVGILIATDLASRGLDLDVITCVINYHLPKEMDLYLHRCGRTARAGREGLVINFVTERDKKLMDRVVRM